MRQSLFRITASFFLFLSHPLFADVPGGEVLIFKTSLLLKLAEKYLCISNIPDTELRQVSLFRFSTNGSRQSSFTLETPHEQIDLSFGLDALLPNNTLHGGYQFTYNPKSDGATPIHVTGKLVLADPKDDPYLPQPKTGKQRKQFHQISSPYAITEEWKSSEYVLLRFFYNLKH